MTVIGRRSGEVDCAAGGQKGRAWAGPHFVGAEGGPTTPAIAFRNRVRSPSGSPSFSRSPSVRSTSTSMSIALSRKAPSYWPRPRPRSHPPTCMAAPHVARWNDRSLAASCPAARSSLVLGLKRCPGSIEPLPRNGWLWGSAHVPGLTRNGSKGSDIAHSRSRRRTPASCGTCRKTRKLSYRENLVFARVAHLSLIVLTARHMGASHAAKPIGLPTP
jgi:hypothetical protein